MVINCYNIKDLKNSKKLQCFFPFLLSSELDGSDFLKFETRV